MELSYSALVRPWNALARLLGGSEERPMTVPVDELFREIESSFPPRYQDAWYIMTETALVACGRPAELKALYRYVTRSTNDTERNRINLRLRDTLHKAWILTGIAPVLTGVATLASAEKELGHVNNGDLHEGWQTIQLNDESYKRGVAFVDRLYAHNLRPTFENLWGSHLQSFRWQQEQIIYGIFLGDHTILSDTETELVSMTALMNGSENPPKLWHMRGFRRLGPTLLESKQIHDCIKIVAAWCGRPTCWPSPDDVEGEV